MIWGLFNSYGLFFFVKQRHLFWPQQSLLFIRSRICWEIALKYTCFLDHIHSLRIVDLHFPFQIIIVKYHTFLPTYPVDCRKVGNHYINGNSAIVNELHIFGIESNGPITTILIRKISPIRPFWIILAMKFNNFVVFI